MRRRTDLRSEPFRAPRAFRPQGRDLDLTACEDAANLKRRFGSGLEPTCAADASGDALTASAGRMIRIQFVTPLRRLPASFASGLTEAHSVQPRRGVRFAQKVAVRP